MEKSPEVYTYPFRVHTEATQLYGLRLGVMICFFADRCARQDVHGITRGDGFYRWPFGEIKLQLGISHKTQKQMLNQLVQMGHAERKTVESTHETMILVRVVYEGDEE